MEALRAVGLGFSPTSIRDTDRAKNIRILGRSGDIVGYRNQHDSSDQTTADVHHYDVLPPPPPPPLSASMSDKDFSKNHHNQKSYNNSDNNPHPHHHTTIDNTSTAEKTLIRPTLDRSMEFQLKEKQLSDNVPLASSSYPTIPHLEVGHHQMNKYHHHQSSSQHSIIRRNNDLNINSTTTTHKMMDVISIKIIRASELMDNLGGTNAYVLLDWGKLGKASTQAVINSNAPYFGSTLKFKSPYQRIRRKDINDDDYRDSNILDILNNRIVGIDDDGVDDDSDRGDEECLISHAGPMKVFVYNRNHSVSDELIGSGEIDVHDQLLSLYSNIILINNSYDNSHGSSVTHDSAVGTISTLYLLDPSGNYKNTHHSVGFIEYTITLH